MLNSCFVLSNEPISIFTHSCNSNNFMWPGNVLIAQTQNFSLPSSGLPFTCAPPTQSICPPCVSRAPSFLSSPQLSVEQQLTLVFTRTMLASDWSLFDSVRSASLLTLQLTDTISMPSTCLAASGAPHCLLQKVDTP